MAGTLGPRDLTTFGYSIGESGWGVATNTSLQTVDALAQLSVLSTTTTAPPSLAGSDEGKAYVIPSGATGAWSGLTGQVAVWSGSDWDYYDPAGTSKTWLNWTVFDYETTLYFVFNGTAWAPVPRQLSGAYSARPTAAAKYVGCTFRATDIGSEGAVFVCTSTPAWKQVGIARIYVATATAQITGSGETSMYGSGVGSLTLPAGCLGIGSTVNARVRAALKTTAGSSFRVKLKYGSTVVGDTGVQAAIVSVTGLRLNADAGFTCRTTGATGTVMPTGTCIWDVQLAGGAQAYFLGTSMAPVSTYTAVTIDTTAATAIDMTMTMVTTNSPQTDSLEAYLDVSGLV